MSFVRTVLGDIRSDHLGIVYAHEHVVIRGEFIEQNFPDFLLEDLDLISNELRELKSHGIGTMIDAMPLDSGRSAAHLVELSILTGMNIVASTGLHLRMYYAPGHWYDRVDGMFERAEEDLLGEIFVTEIEVGMSDSGQASSAKAGVIKIAGSLHNLTHLEKRIFRAAGYAHRLTGCPILTHTEQGTAAMEQVRILQDAGVDLSHVILSHLDRIGDLDYHREVLSTGVRLEYDSAFRWGAKPNQTQALILALAPEFPDQIVIGMDAARSSYWRSYGGKPGLSYLVETFVPSLIDAGLSANLVRKILVDNPASAYSFAGGRG